MCFEESIKHKLPLHPLKQHKDLGPVNLPVDYPLQHYCIAMHAFTIDTSMKNPYSGFKDNILN
jgi:hypothetical protein